MAEVITDRKQFLKREIDILEDQLSVDQFYASDELLCDLYKKLKTLKDELKTLELCPGQE